MRLLGYLGAGVGVVAALWPWSPAERPVATRAFVYERVEFIPDGTGAWVCRAVEHRCKPDRYQARYYPQVYR